MTSHEGCLVLIVICPLIFLRDINHIGASLAFSSTLLNVLTLYLILLFGLLSIITVVILPLSICCPTCIVIFLVAFGMQGVSVPFGMLPMVYFKVTP